MDWFETGLDRHDNYIFCFIFCCLRKGCGECRDFKFVCYLRIAGKFSLPSLFKPLKSGLTLFIYHQITGSLNWVIRTISDIETNVVSVERIKEFEKTSEVRITKR